MVVGWVETEGENINVKKCGVIIIKKFAPNPGSFWQNWILSVVTELRFLAGKLIWFYIIASFQSSFKSVELPQHYFGWCFIVTWTKTFQSSCPPKCITLATTIFKQNIFSQFKSISSSVRQPQMNPMGNSRLLPNELQQTIRKVN